MLTPREAEKLVAQVNDGFKADRERIVELEKRVKALEATATKPVKATKEEK